MNCPIKLVIGLLTLVHQVPLATSVCEKPPAYPDTEFKSVCYPYVGCFDDNPPFNNAIGDLPKSPEELDVQLRLFTRTTKTVPQLLDYKNISSVTSSNFDAQKLTKFVIHGFSNTGDTPWVVETKDKLLIKGDFNVIVVDWGKGATLPDYNQAVSNLRLVATQVKLLLDMFEKQGASYNNLHMIGHSLGAHMSGYVGLLSGSRIGRITGMDPAEPDFECLPTLVRLDPGDAMFVDVIHTNGEPLASGGAGLFQQSGHVDFYVNGGKTQPGCKDGISGAISSLFSSGSVGDDVACSHARSHDLFIESIDSKCPFTAFPCESYETFLLGACTDCGRTGCSSVGYYADQFYGTGKMYLNTRASAPFCGYQYVFKVTVSNSTKDTKGTLFASLVGAYGSTDFAQITGKDSEMKAGQVIMGVGAFSTEVGPVKSVTLKYEKYGGVGIGWFKFGGGEKSVTVVKVDLLSGETGLRYDLCFGEFELKHQEEMLIPPTASGTC